MIYCHKCGRRTGKHANVCSNCGSYLRKRGHSTNYTLVIIRAILLVALVLFFIYLFNKYLGT
ncbi:hypothetical protein HYX18_01780 [Candidatus Woesearchaeota archaeon]|nr:hypothetical protein [Candidatus Woesearchaeota archaeon]